MVVKFGETMKISPKIMSSLCYGQTFHKISCDPVLRYVLMSVRLWNFKDGGS